MPPSRPQGQDKILYLPLEEEESSPIWSYSNCLEVEDNTKRGMEIAT